MSSVAISLQGVAMALSAGALAAAGIGLLVTPIGTRTRVVDSVVRSPMDRQHHSARQRVFDAVVRVLPVRGSAVTAEAAEWVVWIRQLAALLRVGRTSASAFEVAAQSLAESPEPSRTGQRIELVCHTVARASVIGKPPSATLQSLALTAMARVPALRRIEVKVLTDLARCWEVSEQTGAPLAALLDGLAEATEADLDAAAARETALAGSRATVNILTWLPVAALGLGVLIGANPLRTLLTTPWGIAAAVVGAVLTVIGRMWTGRLVRRAEQVTERPYPSTSRTHTRRAEA